MKHTNKKADEEIGKKSQAVRAKLIERTAKCEEVARRGQAALAQEVVQTVDLPHQIYIDSAEGPYLTDLDGNRYIDLTGGFGPNVLGNKPEPVQAAIGPQIEKGWHYGIPNGQQARLAEL
ncbi:MAG TPA: aminotransferase class III-fold pyridoxal phosphate-dependent enzyme, partial [SAR86 cluster bacterium]|nr:aminotransferase class III-fold pyridoxal phosphate-dependent enzyme [SAR86 cluster bacterium]